jgi:hypothetical protein
MTDAKPQDTLADNLLRGVKAIAEFRGESPRRMNYLLERGLLPGFKIGNRWYLRKSKHQAMIEELEEEAAG